MGSNGSFGKSQYMDVRCAYMCEVFTLGAMRWRANFPQIYIEPPVRSNSPDLDRRFFPRLSTRRNDAGLYRNPGSRPAKPGPRRDDSRTGPSRWLDRQQKRPWPFSGHRARSSLARMRQFRCVVRWVNDGSVPLFKVIGSESDAERPWKGTGRGPTKPSSGKEAGSRSGNGRNQVAGSPRRNRCKSSGDGPTDDALLDRRPPPIA